MAGYELKDGKYDKRNISESELWDIFNDIFTIKSRNATSYKYGFLKSILDNLYNADSQLNITFDILFGKFAEIYWNLVLRYRIRQMPITKDKKESVLERVLLQAVEKFEIIEGASYESLSEEAINWITANVKRKCMENVVGALYKDTCEIFYSFSKAEEWIQINPLVYDFLTKYRGIIEKLNYYEWAKYLEKINDEAVTNELLSKLDESAKRSDLTVYRNILFNEFENRDCFYCGKGLKEAYGIEVDHFIPWCLIKDDQLWNLVLACTDCNRKKNDKIPDAIFLDKIIERNRIIKDSNLENKKMKNYRKDKLIKLYEGVRGSKIKGTWKPK